MKKPILARLVPLLALSVSAAACEGLTDLNDNPNAPTDVPAKFLLTEGQQDAAFSLLGSFWNVGHGEVLAQHLAQIQYAEEDLYLWRSDAVNTSFRNAYSGYLMDFHTVARLGAEENEPNVQAAGLIMRSWGMQNLTDLFGDLPYSEAFGGVEGGIITPKFDTQAQIYDKMLADLAAASAMIKPNENPFGAQDLIYQGKMSQWRLLANSLRLRMAMRISDVNATKARTEAQAALAPTAGGVIASADDNAEICYSSTTRNPWFEYWLGRPGDYRVSHRLVSTLKSLGDPRLPAYAQPITADTAYGGRPLAPGEKHYEGMPNGMAENDYKFSQASQPGTALLDQSSCLPLMTSEEVLFLRAEAAARGFTSENAGQLYNAAIRASMERWGVSSAAITAYLARPDVQWDAARWRQLIGVQKWIALYGQGLEAFAEVRRLNFPVLTPGPDAVLASIPARIPYPFSESTFNQGNLQEAQTRQGITGAANASTARMWWDVS